ncbi:MAG: hypothetical protein KIT61_05280 [Pyrinomonadaceae bacterium]|nr:hypothetical protein [Pyrinomonadaceae bacterium]
MPDENRPPDEKLADEIAGKLLAAGHIPARRVEIVTTKLLTGTATEEDWRNWIDTARSDSQRSEVHADV